MISSYFRIFSILFLITFSALGQRTGVYLQPEVSLNYSPPSRWSFNFEMTNRNLVNNNAPATDKFSGEHLEFSHFSSYESGFYSKISLGIRYRNRDWFRPDRGNEFRVTQQYSYSKPFNQFRWAHRVRFEQRFYEAETVYRTRYRLSLDFPLQGISLNTNEFYAVISTEALYSLSAKSATELDQRLTTGLGYQMTKFLKLQFSAEYRLDNYLNFVNGRVFGYTSALFKL